MSATMTFPNLEFSADPASGTIHGAPTMPVGALAWSAAEPDEPVGQTPRPAGPAAPTKAPRISRTALGAVLFGAVTVVAALGAIMLGGNDSPSTPLAVVDHTRSAPYVPPAPLPTVSHVAAPTPVAREVTAAVVAPPKVVAPVQPTAVPPVAETPKPTQHRPHWNWLPRILQHHDQDGEDRTR